MSDDEVDKLLDRLDKLGERLKLVLDELRMLTQPPGSVAHGRLNPCSHCGSYLLDCGH